MTSDDALRSESSRESVRESVLTEYFDKKYAVSIIEKLGMVCHDTYFRSEFVGFEEPIERSSDGVPYILISNHSGMAFPWDAMVFVSLYNYEKRFGEGSFRVLVAPMLSETALMNPYLIPNMWKKMGGIDATFRNFETLMNQSDYNVMMYPEGVPGIGKGFNRKYKLQKFHTSYVRMAVKYKTDLHWVSTVNGEYINPYSYSFEWINKVVRKIGIPFLPISLMLVGVVLQPWVFYFAFPAKLNFVRGPRIRPCEMIDKEYEDITQEEFVELSAKIRDIAQKHIDEAVSEHGKPNFDFGELFANMWKNRVHFPFYFPFFWPLIYTEFERKSQEMGSSDFDMPLTWRVLLRMLLKNPIFFAYFVPILGWIPILIKGYTGHHINDNERRRKTSAFGDTK